MTDRVVRWVLPQRHAGSWYVASVTTAKVERGWNRYEGKQTCGKRESIFQSLKVYALLGKGGEFLHARICVLALGKVDHCKPQATIGDRTRLSRD